MTEYLLNAFFGLIVGLVGGYAGIAAAPLLIFLLVTFLGYTQHTAQGTVAAIMLGPMTLPALYVMRDRLRPLLPYAVIGVVTYACISYFGATYTYKFSNQNLRLLFSGLLIVLGLLHMSESLQSKIDWKLRFKVDAIDSEHQFYQALRNVLIMLILGGIIGFIGGFFGIGAGVIMVPLLIWPLGLNKDDARALSLMILLPPVSIGAVIKYNSMGDVLWPMVVVGFAAYFASNYWGAKIGCADTPYRFSIIMGILLLVFGIIHAYLTFKTFGL